MARYIQLIQPPAWAKQWGHDEWGRWVTFGIRAVEQRMRWIPPGRFWMGSSEDEEVRLDPERPRHEVELTRGYWLFDTPCTQALWQAVMGENPSLFQGENRPIERVSWEDCQAFMGQLNEALPGLELGLPTEAQWEYACRAGTQTARYDSNLDAIAWYEANSGEETHEVGQKQPNAWGLYDMLGNVWEWCHDGRRDYAAGLVTDPVVPTDAGAKRVYRGGGWFYPAPLVRAACRLCIEPFVCSPALGFRGSSSGMSFADGMRRERSRAENGAREDRARSHDGGR